MVYNEIHLLFLTEQTKKYSHPPDSQQVQLISLTGNFAPASNQCGFIVTEARITNLKPDEIQKFYASILTDVAYDKGPPYHEVSLYLLSDKKERETLALVYPDVYEQITYQTMIEEGAYLLLTAETGYPPNDDFRCH